MFIAQIYSTIIPSCNAQFVLLFVGLALFFGGVIFGIVKARVVAPQKIDDHYVWLSGVNADYLDLFPEWHGARRS